MTHRLAAELARTRDEYREGLEQRRRLRAQQAETARRLQAPSGERPRFKPGDLVQVEVLEALPDRPISGICRVQPDGTISLEYHGDLMIAGLDRGQAKAALIKPLRYSPVDEVLGSEGGDEHGNWVQVDPLKSDRLFIREVDPDIPTDPVQGRRVAPMQVIEGRLGVVIRRLDALQKGTTKPAAPE